MTFTVSASKAINLLSQRTKFCRDIVKPSVRPSVSQSRASNYSAQVSEMAKLRQFEIFFDKPMPIYQAGELVTGAVVLGLDEPMKMRALQLLVHGAADVFWRESSGTGDSKTTHTYSNHESYFEHFIGLWGATAPGESGNDPSHPQGHFTYQFQFLLPPVLPSSFEIKQGHVRYWVKATIGRSWKFDHNCKRPFTVLSHLDLNIYQPNILLGLEGRDQKTLCCWCCASGPISATVRIAKQGYVPGEPIYINAKIENNSSRKMRASRVEFKQVTSCHATNKTNDVTNTILTLQRGEIDAGGTECWENVQLVVPPLPPSYLVGCRIIDIRYALHFVVDPSGPAFDLEVPLEVIIGTIPLQQMWSNFSTNTSYGMGAESTPMVAMPTAPTQGPSHANPSALTAPTPTYSQSVFGKSRITDDQDNLQYTSGELDYAPFYAYYNFNQGADQEQCQQPPQAKTSRE
ncbi:unnamed protein product [Owenia fusiformis]|uniref:Arrestin C-terminal-like domain-containing protein n=1 Tax=Owenia fusiformis TaxID=6347 RepID=A0A8S4PVE2_OWEFU|nr:unnamed protein product [Owenia fusiformis]